MFNYPSIYPNQMQTQMQAPNGFVSVRSEAEARAYPVAYGNSVTMKDETAPYIYTKSMGFSQLDRPIFDKYKLVKEETTPEAPECAKSGEELEGMKKDIAELKEAVKGIKEGLEYGA